MYVDEVYYALLVVPAERLAFMARVFDVFLDSLAWVWSRRSHRFLGAAGSVRSRTGWVQFYALSMALGLAVFLLASWCSGSRVREGGGQGQSGTR